MKIMKHVKLFEAFKEKPKKDKLELDLNSPEGNAISVIGLAKKLASQLGYSQEEIKTLVSDMMSSDYNNLIHIFNDKFGEFVDIYNFKDDEEHE